MKKCIVGLSKTSFYDNNQTIKQNAAVDIYKKFLMALLQHHYFLAAATSQCLKTEILKIFQTINIICRR
ncbi:MAG TPA: hypothetical protein VHG34_00090, partial [Nitrososphaeraceae archaeon]|nr:hypothetical protein [Nitrososphaeraceae archaeon]